MSRRRARRRLWPALAGALLLAVLAGPWDRLGSAGTIEDAAGGRCLRPLTRAHAIQVGPHRTWVVTSLRRAGDGYEFVRDGRPARLGADQLLGEPAPRFYPLGTDGLGRDLAARVLAGLRHSTFIGGLAVGLAVLAGVGIGGTAGLAGGWTDAALMRAVDVVASIPRLVLFLLCAALVEPSGTSLVVVLAATTWTGLARIVRTEVLSARAGGAALAARASGASGLRLLLRHMVPLLAPVLAVTASLRFADTVVLESALSFLGLGVPHGAVSLGGVMASGRDVLAEAWWVAAWPGLLVVALVVSVRSAVRGLLGSGEPPSLI